MTRNKSYADGYATVCLECMRGYSKEKRKDVNYLRARQAKKFNTTPEHLHELFATQSVCQICKQVDERRALSIDHNHSTGKVRGLLCDACNKALGCFKDSIENLENAIQYLKDTNG
jgi:hypothetical protein